MAKKKEIIILLIILAIAAFFRFFELADIPPGLYPDVAINGNDALDALKTGDFKVFYPENNGREGLFINLIALSFLIFGPSILAIKIVAAVIGILTVFGLYLLTKELFKKTPIALLSAFFLATSFWHTNFSRIGFRGILVPFILVFSSYFLFRALRTNKLSDFIISGVFFGLGFYTYISFRMAVLILPAIIIPFWFVCKKNKVQKKYLFSVFYFLFSIFLVALPIGLYFLDNPQDFISRAGGVSIFAQENPFKAFFESFIKHLGMFNIRGDGNWRHNFADAPMLSWPVGIFFLIGLVISIKDLFLLRKEKNYFRFYVLCFMLSWFLAMLLPGILTYEGVPHALRVIGVVPALYIFAGLGAFWFIEKAKPLTKNLKLFFIFYFLLFALSGYAEYDKYFVDWAKHPTTSDEFSKEKVEIGLYLNSLTDNIEKFVIINEAGVPAPWPDGLPMPAQTPMFIERTVFNEPQAAYLKENELDKIKPAKKAVIIPIRFDKELFDKLKELHPEGEAKKENGVWIYLIKK